MQLLKDRIIKDGTVLTPEILKVDCFLNHQIDVDLLDKIGEEFRERFNNEKITKILTIEASGIAVACMAAQYFKVPVVFAKKCNSRNLDKEIYQSDVYSYTKQKTYTIRVSKKYLKPMDNILIIDDFLANGAAAKGLIDIINLAEAKLSGIGIVIEKGFQDGGKKLRKEGFRVESLAIINSMNENGQISFA